MCFSWLERKENSWWWMLKDRNRTHTETVCDKSKWATERERVKNEANENEINKN